MENLQRTDSEIFELVQAETQRQRDKIRLQEQELFKSLK